MTTVVSGEVGVRKPEPAIFELAIDAIGVPADRSVYIGNSFANDVEGAAAVGLDTVWLDERANGPPSNAKYQPNATIQTLRELRPILGLESA